MANENGKSHWIRNITIIFVISLLLWQFLIPYIDSSIKTPSEYINDFINPDSTESTWNIYVINQVTGEKTSFRDADVSNHYDMQPYETFEIGIESNIPGKIFGEYSWIFLMDVFNNTSHLWETYPYTIKIPAYTCYFTHSWKIPESIVFINWDMVYTFDMKLTDTDGVYLHPVSVTWLTKSTLWIEPDGWVQP